PVMTLEETPAQPSPQGRRTIPLTEITLPHECPRPVRLYVLGRAPYFRGLDEEVLAGVDARMTARSVPAGAPNFREGEEVEALSVVAEGRVNLSRLTAAGTETVTDLLVPGELFGAMSTLGESIHHQSASALVGTCVLR